MTEAPRPAYSAAAERNRGPILEQLLRLLPASGSALEIAAGTGQHAAHFAAALPGWTWQPTDADANALTSIEAWCRGLPNVRPARQLDVLAPSWADIPTGLDLIYASNLLHIAPWAVCTALMKHASQHLRATGLLVTYGAVLIDGVPTAASNLAFDADLRARNPAWGLRRLADIETQAQEAGLVLRETIALPANNHLLVWALA
ncbi:MAG: class I SAM-dependent methyltransferase [Burkholderiales bacterium]|nr:class I SAM-dependent methyltransferase [Burkholderiales bacterium]